MKIIPYALATILAACSNSSGGSPDAAHAIDTLRSIDAPSGGNVVTGTLGGATYAARDAISGTATASGSDLVGPSTTILITDFAGSCQFQDASSGVPNERLIVLFLGVTDAANQASPVTEAGTYTINPAGSMTPASSHVAEASFEIDGATCSPTAKEFGVSGSVIVTSADDPIQATFDLTFDNGDHVTGSFTAASCAGLDPNRSPSC